MDKQIMEYSYNGILYNNKTATHTLINLTIQSQVKGAIFEGVQTV